MQELKLEENIFGIKVFINGVPNLKLNWQEVLACILSGLEREVAGNDIDMSKKR